MICRAAVEGPCGGVPVRVGTPQGGATGRRDQGRKIGLLDSITYFPTCLEYITKFASAFPDFEGEIGDLELQKIDPRLGTPYPAVWYLPAL